MMKNTIIIAGVSATLAFSAAWLIKPDVTADEHDQEVNASKQTSRSSRASKASPSLKPPPRGRHRSAEMVEEENSIEALDLETQKQMELAEEKQRKMLRDQLGGGFDLRIAVMVKELGLDSSQEEALRGYFDQQLELLSAGNPMENMTDPEAIKKMAAAMRHDGMLDSMKGILSDEQMEGLEAIQKRQKKNKIEGAAMKNLSKVQQALDLTDDQRDAVYNVLVEDAEKFNATQSDANVVMDGMMKAMGLDIDTGGMDMGVLMQMDAEQDGGEVDQASLIAEMKENRAKLIDEKVERMAGVLDESQIKQYRNHLEGSGGIMKMMLQGMESDGE